MKISNKTVLGSFFQIWTRLSGSDPAQHYAVDELPLRSELFSANQMELHGKILADLHQLKAGRNRDHLLARLAENEKLLLEVYNLLTEDIKVDRRITPAGEWLLDNFLFD
jgi:cyclic beta-1,2-glucan synthetase